MRLEDGKFVGKLMIDVGVNSKNIREKDKLFDIQKILTPPDYCEFSEFRLNGCHDFGLVILEKPLSFDKNLRPVCLPEPNQEFEKMKASSIGWGLYEVQNKKVIKIDKTGIGGKQ